MASETWFVLCDTSFLPDTEIKLGQLITDPRTPAQRLGDGPLEPGPLDVVLPSYLETGRTIRTVQNTHLGVGLSAKVLSLLPFSVAGNRQKHKKQQYEIDNIKSQKFVPSEHYVRKSIFQPRVLSYLAKHKYNKSVYMIVGIKVGSNAYVVREGQRKVGGNVSGLVPLGAAVGIPVDLQAKVSATTSKDRFDAYRVPNDFVFAYRLQEIRYFKKNGFIENYSFTRGADLHDLDNHDSQDRDAECDVLEKYQGVKDEIEVEGISGYDFEDNEDDSVLVDGCIMLGVQEEIFD